MNCKGISNYLLENMINLKGAITGNYRRNLLTLNNYAIIRTFGSDKIKGCRQLFKPIGHKNVTTIDHLRHFKEYHSLNQNESENHMLCFQPLRVKGFTPT